MAAAAVFKSEKLKKFLLKIGKRANEAVRGDRKFARAIAPIVFADVIEHFQNGQGSKGRWKDWSSSYAGQMQRKGKGGNKILQDAGRLRNSFVPTNFKSASQGIVWFNPAKTSGGFPYAAAHDEGGPQLPQRDFMWLSDKAMDKIGKASLGHLLKR